MEDPSLISLTGKFFYKSLFIVRWVIGDWVPE